jgi:hypothetical protein
MMKKFGVFMVVGGLTVLSQLSLAAEADKNWRMMSRQGGCVSFQKAAERKPVFLGIEGPDEFIERLKRRHIAYEAKEEMIEGLRTVALRAPSLSLSIFIVPLKFCK